MDPEYLEELERDFRDLTSTCYRRDSKDWWVTRYGAPSVGIHMLILIDKWRVHAGQ